MKLIVEGFMPLSIERIGTNEDGRDQIAISHTGLQNGDVMFDPEMVFQIRVSGDLKIAEPISFRNDYLGLHQEVYRYNDEGKATHVNTRLKAELKSFARMWFRNLKHQGFFSGQAVRQGLS
ncbi:MAG: hypothetical protein R3B83_10640 [Nitrospirales bacterium]|nr:hypothetical protein [Nitrospirales bacterium]